MEKIYTTEVFEVVSELFKNTLGIMPHKVEPINLVKTTTLPFSSKNAFYGDIYIFRSLDLLDDNTAGSMDLYQVRAAVETLVRTVELNGRDIQNYAVIKQLNVDPLREEVLKGVLFNKIDITEYYVTNSGLSIRFDGFLATI